MVDDDACVAFDMCGWLVGELVHAVKGDRQRFSRNRRGLGEEPKKRTVSKLRNWAARRPGLHNSAFL